MYDKFLSVVFQQEYDVTNKKDNLEVFLKVDVKALRGGLLKEVNGSDLTVLMAIASYMDINGKCYPTQRQLAEVTGMSLTTINRAIKNLLEIEVNGYPVLERKLVGKGNKKSSIYTIFDLSPVQDDTALDVDAEEDKPLNAKDIAHYFATKYEEEYGLAYVINYKRDLALIKNKLVDKFDNDTIKAMIDIIMAEYRNRWANGSYTHPTIAMMCTWLGQKAIEILLQEKAKESETDALIELAETNNNSLDFDML